MQTQTATEEKEKRKRHLTEAEVAELKRKGVRIVDIDSERKAPAVERPTEHRIARGGVIVAPDERMGRPKPWHTFENIHDGMLAEGRISNRAWNAANEFLAKYQLANGSGARAGGYGEPVSKSTGEMSFGQANAKLEVARWSRIMAPDLFSLLETVLATGQKSPSGWARDRDMHPTAGAYLLAAAIEQFSLSK